MKLTYLSHTTSESDESSFGTYKCTNCEWVHGAVRCQDGTSAWFKSKTAGRLCLQEMWRAKYLSQAAHVDLLAALNTSAMTEHSDDPIHFWPAKVENDSQLLRSNGITKIVIFMPDGREVDAAQAPDCFQASQLRAAGQLN